MKAKDILLIGSGVAIGYLIFKKDLFKKKGSGLSQLTGGAGEIVSGAEQVVGGAVSTVSDTVNELVNPRQAECEKKWVDTIGSLTRFASQEAMESSKANFVKECMLTK
jgi:X-X-X-Leu-X-X-Gly heptad repeat protein